MLSTSHIAAHLTSLLGPDHVREENNTITAAPADTQQISELLRYANENCLTVNPIGGGTKQSWGNPTQTNILLDTTRLNRVLEHSWQDLTCTVQAGCTWSAMQQTLAQHNQFVALDPLWPTRATVGGIVATNDSGALRHRYGSLRDLIIGMTIVLADGTIAKSGGKVVKNVAGYDLHKLMTGAFGTLGIIAEVTFRLHPLPLHAQTFTVSAPQAAQLAPLIAAIRDSHLLAQALQLRGNSHGFHLDIQLNAHPSANQPTLLHAMASELGLSCISATEPAATASATATATATATETATETETDLSSASKFEPNAFASEIGLGFSPGIPPANKPGFSPREMQSFEPDRTTGGSSGLQAAESNPTHESGFSPGPPTNPWQAREYLFAASENNLILKITALPTDITVVAHDAVLSNVAIVAQAIGIAYVNLPLTTNDPQAIFNLIESMSLTADCCGGTLTLLSAPATYATYLHQRVEKEIGTLLPSVKALTQSIKHQFDPNRILGGI